MAADHAVEALETFLDLERRLKAALTAVTFTPQNLGVHSPTFAGLLLECGSLCESILKSGLDNPRYSGIAGIANIRAKRYAANPPYFNINDARIVFRPDQFYAKPVWYVPRSDTSYPWWPWRLATPSHPGWWNDYNVVKHNRFGNAAKAKLGTAVHAMKATFLALIQTLDFREKLVELGVIRSASLDVAALQAVAAEWEPLATPELVIARTELFAYRYRTLGYPTSTGGDVADFL